MSKLRIATLLSLALASSGWLVLGRSTESAPAVAHGRAPTSSTVVAPGRIEPVRSPVVLSFEVGGRITSIEVEEGDRVTAGQVIARIDDRVARAHLAKAKAKVAGATAQLGLVRHGARRQEIDAANADLDAARVTAEHRAVELARSRQLGASGAVSSASVDADAASARVADANAVAASARYESLKSGNRPEQVAAAGADLEAATAELESARLAVEQTIVRSPRDGVVLRRFAEVGGMVTVVPQFPVVSVADLSQLEVRLEIDEADIAGVSVGAVGYATADAFEGKKFAVHVTRVTGELGRKTTSVDDPRARFDTRVLEVIARFDEEVTLPLGLRVHVTLGTETRVANVNGAPQ